MTVLLLRGSRNQIWRRGCAARIPSAMPSPNSAAWRSGAHPRLKSAPAPTVARSRPAPATGQFRFNDCARDENIG